MTEAQSARPLPATPGRSWWPFAGAIALAAVVGAGLLGTYGLVIFRLRHSAAGREAVSELARSAQLQALLGQPLHLHVEGGDLQHDGQASLTVRARGPRGTAQVELASRAHGRRWQIVGGTVTGPGDRQVPLELTPAPTPAPAGPQADTSPQRGRGPQP